MLSLLIMSRTDNSYVPPDVDGFPTTIDIAYSSDASASILTTQCFLSHCSQLLPVSYLTISPSEEETSDKGSLLFPICIIGWIFVRLFWLQCAFRNQRHNQLRYTRQEHCLLLVLSALANRWLSLNWIIRVENQETQPPFKDSSITHNTTQKHPCRYCFTASKPRANTQSPPKHSTKLADQQKSPPASGLQEGQVTCNTTLCL